MNLGASVAAKLGKPEPGDVIVPRALTGAAVFIRLCLVPALSIALTTGLRRYAPVLVPSDDPALALVLMLESAPPAAMQTMIFCQLFGPQLERPLGRLLVAEYTSSLLLLTGWIALALSLLAV